MPELPEVDTIVRSLRFAGIEGARIVAVETDWPKMFSPLSAEVFTSRIKGRKIVSVDRRGKFIRIRLPEQVLLLHLRMSGRINLVDQGRERSPYEHLVLDLDDGRQIRFHDTRKFGRAYLTDDENMVLGRLGVEPLGTDFNLTWLKGALSVRYRMIKPLLLDQSFIAGLGNIYVDEALWDAHIHPMRISNSLSQAEVKALRFAIPKVLRRGLKNNGTSLGDGHGNYSAPGGRRGNNQDSLKVYGRQGLPCLECGALIEKIIVAQRGTHVCPSCQPLPGSVSGA